MMLTMML